MKILFSCTSTNKYGGIEYHLLDLMTWFRERGITTALIAREEGYVKDMMAESGFHVHTVNKRGRRKWLAPLQTAQAILKESPDIISVNREHDIILTYYTLKVMRPFLSKTPKLVAVIHTPTGRPYPMLKNFDGVVFTSQHTKRAFVKEGTAMEKKSPVLYNGIEMWSVDRNAKFDRNRERKFFKDRGFPIIGMVGNLWKNQEELIDVARFVVDDYPGITIAIVGRGCDALLKEKTKKYNLEKNFVITGAVERKYIPDIFYDFDLSVTTHRNEGFGIVHIESLASYTPVVAYNRGGYVEMLGEGGAVLVNGGPRDFAGAVKQVLGSDAQRKRLAMEGKKVVEGKYSIDQMCRSHLSYYEKVITD